MPLDFSSCYSPGPWLTASTPLPDEGGPSSCLTCLKGTRPPQDRRPHPGRTLLATTPPTAEAGPWPL